MFAVVRTGGKQYRVAAGDKIVVEKLDGNAGDRVELGEVLLAGEGGNLTSTDGLVVAAEIVAQAKGDKVTVFKKRRRHNYRRKQGHRQQHTILKIVAIGDHKEQKPARSKASSEQSVAAAEITAPAAEAATVKSTAAPVKKTGKAQGPMAEAAAAQGPSGPAQVEAEETPNPAPDNEAQANPPAQSTDAPAKPSRGRKAPADKPTAETRSTQNVAPAKPAKSKAEGGATGKSPKTKK